MIDDNGNKLYPRAADPHNEPVKFIDTLEMIGFMNGVINLTFTTALFSAGRPSPNADVQVVTDPIVSCRLRMDLHLAQQVHTALGKIIASNTKPSSEKAN